ncbi:hypothetical protein PG984_016606 [Apiospora sp. TS-2023a]
MPGYLEAIARVGLDEDVAEAGKCCNVRCVTTLHLFENGIRHCAVAETKPEGKPQDLGEKPGVATGSDSTERSLDALTEFMNLQLKANPGLVQKPMFINILILEFTLRSYQKGIREQRDRLRHIEQGNSQEDVTKQAETLHDLSVQWHCMLKDLEDIKQHIQVLLMLQQRLGAMSMTKSSPPVVHGDDEATAATDDLHHLEAVRGFWARWANTYLERTNIRIQLVRGYLLPPFLAL